jgi:hypothetical protein
MRPEDGSVLVSQSNACFAYLGRKFGLWGNNVDEVTQCEQLLCEIMDIRNDFTSFCYGRSGSEPADLMAQNSRRFEKLEIWLGTKASFSQGAPFLVGGHASAPDFHFFEMLDQHLQLVKYFDLSDFFYTFSEPENLLYWI